MPKSDEKLLEMETTILWNELEPVATLWTASPKVRKEWESFGFPVEVWGGGWRAQCPKDRISYRMLKK